MISIDISRYKIEVTKHAIIRSVQRKITPDMVETTVRCGKIKRIGKSNLKFYKKFKRFTVVCVDEICDDKITIVTVLVKK